MLGPIWPAGANMAPLGCCRKQKNCANTRCNRRLKSCSCSDTYRTVTREWTEKLQPHTHTCMHTHTPRTHTRMHTHTHTPCTPMHAHTHMHTHVKYFFDSIFNTFKIRCLAKDEGQGYQQLRCCTCSTPANAAYRADFRNIHKRVSTLSTFRIH